MTDKNEKPKVYEKDCPHCGKLFYSLSEKQLLFNYTSHIGSCKFKKEQKDKESVEPSTFSKKKELKK